MEERIKDWNGANQFLHDAIQSLGYDMTAMVGARDLAGYDKVKLDQYKNVWQEYSRKYGMLRADRNILPLYITR